MYTWSVFEHHLESLVTDVDLLVDSEFIGTTKGIFFSVRNELAPPAHRHTHIGFEQFNIGVADNQSHTRLHKVDLFVPCGQEDGRSRVANQAIGNTDRSRGSITSRSSLLLHYDFDVQNLDHQVDTGRSRSEILDVRDYMFSERWMLVPPFHGVI